MAILNEFPDAEITEKELDAHIQKEVEVKGDADVEIPPDLLPPPPPDDESGTETDESGTGTGENDTETDESGTEKDTEAELGLFMFFLPLAWTNIFHMADKRFVKSGVKKNHYNLTIDQKNQLEKAFRPVLAKWLMNAEYSPEMHLLMCLVGISGGQVLTAWMSKNEQEEIERKRKKKAEKTAETVIIEPVGNE